MSYKDIENALHKLILKDRCPQSFIFYGKNKSEIERISREFSFKILGTNVKSFRDIVEFRCDRKSISVDEIRLLNMELLKKPENFKNKVILVYDADKMTNQAQNSFLKSLEDSNENIFIILIVNNIKNIISTVLSRCLLIKFDKMNISEYVKKLEGYSLVEYDLKELYYQTKGDIDISKSILNKECVYKIYLHVIKLFECLCKNYIIDIFEFGNEINNYKDYVDVFLETVVEISRDLFIYENTKDQRLINSRYFKDFIIKHSGEISICKIQNILDGVNEFRNRIKFNLNIEMCYKIFILKIVGE